jgi:epsin
VREATSNDAWGPSTTLMSEIADLTYNVVAYAEIMPILWRRLEDTGRNWRHVYKSLVLLDYLVRTGSERVARECRERAWAIQSIADSLEFAESGEGAGQDRGAGVRERARALTALLRDDDRLRNERAKALKARERFAQNSAAISAASLGVSASLFLFIYFLQKP